MSESHLGYKDHVTYPYITFLIEGASVELIIYFTRNLSISFLSAVINFAIDVSYILCAEVKYTLICI